MLAKREREQLAMYAFRAARHTLTQQNKGPPTNPHKGMHVACNCSGTSWATPGTNQAGRYPNLAICRLSRKVSRVSSPETNQPRFSGSVSPPVLPCGAPPPL